MNFDHTYITLFGYIIFEPGVIITNLVFFVLCAVYFKRLGRYDHDYARQMAWFILLMGTSSVFGALAHAVHYQLGSRFFDSVLFTMNALSLFSIYFCFRAPYTYYTLGREPSRLYIYLAIAWVAALLALSLVNGNFLLIKIHAGIVLVYSLVVHLLAYRRNYERGSAYIVCGISVSFFSIIVHSFRISLHEWFNYKDIAHLIMIVSLVMIYHGIRLNLESMEQNKLLEGEVAGR